MEGQKGNEIKRKEENREAAEKRKNTMKVCPICGSRMEEGYVASRMIAWSNKKISNWSFKGLWSGEIVVSRDYPYPIANVEATRCIKCKIIVFKYGETSNAAKENQP